MQYFCSDIDMIRIFTRRKRLLTIILLTVFVALVLGLRTMRILHIR